MGAPAFPICGGVSRGVTILVGGGLGLLVNSRGKHFLSEGSGIAADRGERGDGWEGSDWLQREYEE
jgi:hypothetical protein